MGLIQLAEMIQEDPSDIVRTLFMKGIMLSMNQASPSVQSFICHVPKCAVCVFLSLSEGNLCVCIYATVDVGVGVWVWLGSYSYDRSYGRFGCVQVDTVA